MRLRRDAWRSFVAQLYSGDDPRLDRIAELGLKTDALGECFDHFAEFPDVDDWPHQEPADIGLDALKSQVREYVEHMQQISTHFPKERGSDGLMNRYEQIIRQSNHADWEVLGDFFELLEGFDSGGKATQKCWHDKKVAKAEQERFADFRERAAKPALEWWYQTRYAFVIELLSACRKLYDAARQASGGLSYQDLLVVAANSLKKQPRLREYFQRRFTHILVDEFQDTDPVQAEILAYLTSSDNTQTDWQKCEPRAGSLFLVGDPKQSIYRFRRADIVTYRQVKQMFERSGGVSFRCERTSEVM